MKELHRQALRRAEKTKSKLIQLKFDELNVLKEIDALYAGLEMDNRKQFRFVWRERYREIWTYLKGKEPDEDILDELVDISLAALTEEPNKLTKYVYETEALRKRDRAREAVLAAPTKMQKQLEIDKAIRIWSQMTDFYVDIAEDDASETAMKDAGVKKVRWMVYGDDRVCSQCEDLNGTVWDIGRVPDKPHLRCRCYLIPIT